MYTLQPTNALLVIDLQNDFCPGGALAVPDGDAIVPTINALAQKFDHVILTQDWHPPHHISFAATHPNKKPFESIQAPYGPQTLWPDHCLQHTPGAALHPPLSIPHAELILRKGFRRHIDSYSALNPSNSAPSVISSRFTARAKALSFIFFFTPATSTSRIDLLGFTSAQAVKNPASSSHANNVLSKCDSRATPE